MQRNIVALLGNEEARSLIEKACKEKGFVYAGFEELIEAIIEQMGRRRRAGLPQQFDAILDEIREEE